MTALHEANAGAQPCFAPHPSPALPLDSAPLLRRCYPSSAAKLPPSAPTPPPPPPINPNAYCSDSLTNALHYTQVAGIITGQLVIGFFADRIGRKWGSVLNASFMLVCEPCCAALRRAALRCVALRCVASSTECLRSLTDVDSSPCSLPCSWHPDGLLLW